MDIKVVFYIVIVLVVFGGGLFGTMVYGNDYAVLNTEVLESQKVIDVTSIEPLLKRSHMIDFIMEESKLKQDEAEYLLELCKEKEIDPFLTLGLIRVESYFNKRLVGTSGDRGLTQIMIATGKSLASNLKIPFDSDRLFDPKYNLLLYATHFSYLKKYYNNDIHKVLTAYNRGQYGLKKYMASRSHRRNAAMSTYSSRVLQYTAEYGEMFEAAY